MFRRCISVPQRCVACIFSAAVVLSITREVIPFDMPDDTLAVGAPRWDRLADDSVRESAQQMIVAPTVRLRTIAYRFEMAVGNFTGCEKICRTVKVAYLDFDPF